MRIIASVCGFLTIASFPAFAVMTPEPEAPEATETTTQCEEGFVWDEETELCVEIKDSRLNREQLFQTASELAYFGRYDDAIALAQLSENVDARMLNIVGFSYRKLGQIDLAFDYYQRALAIDPDLHLARSYMGQGLLTDGRRAEAVAQLHEIRARGGRDTYAYAMLQEALEGSSGY